VAVTFDSDNPLNTLLTATDAARELGLSSVSTIINWRERGYIDLTGNRKHLEIKGLSERGRPMYRFGDIVCAERATRARAGRRYGQAAA
jgi:hypothetical protein